MQIVLARDGGTCGGLQADGFGPAVAQRLRVDGLHAIGNTSAKVFGPAAGATVRRRDASAGPLRLVLNVPQAVMTTGAGLGRSQSGLIALG